MIKRSPHLFYLKKKKKKDIAPIGGTINNVYYRCMNTKNRVYDVAYGGLRPGLLKLLVGNSEEGFEGQECSDQLYHVQDEEIHLITCILSF